MAIEMKHCMACGTRLVMKHLESEGGDVPYCPACMDYRFPVFNVAVSMIVLNETKDRIILIKQYGGTAGILVAGYVNKGEDAEDAAVREVKEELGLEVTSVHFNRSHYFAPSNTLMLNFTVTVADFDVQPNEEVDDLKIMTLEEARGYIKHGSLAEQFLIGYLDGKYDF